MGTVNHKVKEDKKAAVIDNTNTFAVANKEIEQKKNHLYIHHLLKSK